MSKQSEYADELQANSKEWHTAAKALLASVSADSAPSVPSLKCSVLALADAAMRLQASCLADANSNSKLAALSVKLQTQLSASSPPVLKALHACSSIAMDTKDKIVLISATARIIQARRLSHWQFGTNLCFDLNGVKQSCHSLTALIPNRPSLNAVHSHFTEVRRGV